MVKKRIAATAPAFVALSMVVAACGSNTSKTAQGASASSGTASASQCNLSALTTAAHPVNITFWESANGSATSPTSEEYLMLKLVKQFNSSQSQVHVTDVNQQSYFDGTWTPYLNSLQNHTEPNILFFDDYYVQDAVDSKSFIPVASCIAADKYSTSDFLPKSILQQSVNGTLWGMPYTGAGYIMYYNQKALTKAGISAPPTTFAQVVADAAKFKAAGYSDGISVYNQPALLQLFDGIARQYYVNNQNGRAGKSATAAALDNAASLAYVQDVHQMVADGTAKGFSATGPGTSGFDNILAVGNGQAGLTFAPSGTLSLVEAVAPSYPKATIEVAPLPSVGGVNLGLPSEGQSLYLPKSSTPAQLAASWEFLKYLVSATQMATFDAGTGFVRVRTSASQEPVIQSLWAKNPAYKVSWDEMSAGPANNATAGPLEGPVTQIDNDVANMLAKLDTDPTAVPSTLLSQLSSQVTAAIASYGSAS
ncbi:MAG: extracellular solute-binding protein [Acidimicrobiales bacterium]